MQGAEAGAARVGEIGGDRRIDRAVIRSEIQGDGPQELVPLGGRQVGITVEDGAGQGHARSLTAPGDEVVAETGEVGGAGAGGDIASPEADEVAAPIADRLQQVAEEGDRRHRPRDLIPGAGLIRGRPRVQPSLGRPPWFGQGESDARSLRPARRAWRDPPARANPRRRAGGRSAVPRPAGRARDRAPG